jgi:(1->4)-alpha-D-glucan 1-alpha-D-glucosylmutase
VGAALDAGTHLSMTPRVTYRLQFHSKFGFADAAELVPYLARLGISHIYASPYLRARPGSQHGYDIVDHAELNPELGGVEDFERLRTALSAQSMRQILDFVPNHMGVGGADNPLWLNVLEWGKDSAYAGWFDIEWDPERRYLHNKILVPLLGDQYGIELERGQLRLKFDETAGTFAVWAYDTHKLPIGPTHYARILGREHDQLERLGDAFTWLEAWRPQIERRAHELEAELADLVRTRADVREALFLALNRYEGRIGKPESWRALDQLIARQHWRIAHFRVAADDINYRRFFNINDLAGLRMELPDVFDHAHRRVLEWIRDGSVDGLRIDHVDGLQDPKAYLLRLRAQMQVAAGDRRPYLVVEKILAPHERLRPEWPVNGTTGYDFGNLVLGVLIEPQSEAAFDAIYAAFTARHYNFAAMVRECKHKIMDNEMSSELNVLARDAGRLARQNPRTADFTRDLLRRALKEFVACCPVYRTYIDSEGTISEDDRRDIEWALAHARRNEGELDPSVFDFLSQLLCGPMLAPHSGFSRQAVLRCVMRLQQYSGPVMAKGLEDTAFYRYNRFIGLNEVGGTPDRFGISLTAFHKANSGRAESWPHAMLGTATHDTKRGEDVRARLAALSELPEEWERLVTTCSRILRGPVTSENPLPDRNDEYLLYQLLLGSWPVELLDDELDSDVLKNYAERLHQAFRKSIREARLHSNWAFPNNEYEDAALALIDTALLSSRSSSFLAAFVPFATRVATLGVHNSLLQTIFKLTAPGVPDIYQGAELWDLSLVDPDNRRPVDYGTRRRQLETVTAALGADRRQSLREYFKHWRDGNIKLATIVTLLDYRRRYPELFNSGSYVPLTVQGTQSERVCAYARRWTERSLLTLAVRWPVQYQRGFTVDCDVLLSDSMSEHWRDLLTGREFHAAQQRLSAAALFEDLPVAVLVPSS